MIVLTLSQTKIALRLRLEGMPIDEAIRIASQTPKAVRL